ncbi:MAG TPA: flagellar filament capping protein FliD [Bryobacteraceae bacterium]|jgi:flagellar hook-associated protein 2|nr:flagellar filament capping protein FliD [Bryobacteraceae bacterium]
MSTFSIPSPVTVADPTFTGTSKFASSLQQVLARAVGIASLPLNSLQAGLNTLDTRQNALQSLDITFSSLQQSVNSLQSTVTGGLLNASISNGSIVSASVASGATAGTYSIEVDNLGAYSSALSVAGSTSVTNPATQGIATALPLTLSVGSATTTITPATSSLSDLADAINTQAGSQVHATLVNIGSNASPDYRLSLTAANLGTDAIGLTDSSGTNLISTSTPGALASYKVDGGDSISSNTRALTLSPGLTVNLIGQSTPGQATTITVRNDASQLASSFSSFAQAYNTAANAVSQQHGQSGGALQGDSLLQSLSGVLSQLGTYSNGSPEGALANFGITVDQTGQISVDTAAFTSAANANFSGLLTTLGSSDSGGFLKTATDLLSGVEAAGTGSLPSEESAVTSQITAQQSKITDEQATVNQLQTNLTAQIAKADAALAQLETQVSYVTGLFASFTGANNTQSNGLATL